MLTEAGLLAMSEAMLIEVLGRIQPVDGDIELPQMWTGTGPMPMSHAPGLHQSWVSPDPRAPAAELVRMTLERSLLAHYVAAYLGSTACPLPEELARPLWERTEPDAASWRERGYFRPPMPLPDHVSWRDRFLLRAGHEPHPLGHP